MNTWIKNIALIAGGIALSLLLLFIYSQFITPQEKDKLSLISPDIDGVFISAFSGEVYILRDNDTLVAQVGQALLEGDILKVVDDAFCQVQFAQHGTATLNSNTLLKLQRFLNAAKDQDIQTEILMGSMFYRVNKEESGRNFQVESAGTIYEITGTEFLIERSSEGTRLSVTEGSVLVQSLQNLWSSLQTNAGQEVFVPLEAPPESSVPISADSKHTIESLQGLSELVISQKENCVLIVVESDPQGGDIYLDGRKVGLNRFEGLFIPGQTLNFRIRKRGYHDGLLSVETQRNNNQLYRVELLPLPLSETLKEGLVPKSSPSAEIRKEYENQLEQYKENLNQQLEELEEQKQQLQNQQNRLNNLREELEDYKNETADLQEQLGSRDEEINRLKDLITQIQALTES